MCHVGSRTVLRPLHTALRARPTSLPTNHDSLQSVLTRVDKPAHKAQNPIHTSDGPISEAHLSTKTYNALLKGRITTIRQFCAMEFRDLKWLRNFGKKALAEAVDYRAHLGVPLQIEA
jgi:DNA-directed RNA polymerase alpha subunit